MNKNTMIGLVVLVVLIAGYLFYRVSVPSAPLSTGTTTTSGNTVLLIDSGYSPATLTVKQGQTVVFKNQSSAGMWTASAMHPAHTAYSGTSLSEHCPDVTNTSFDACRGYQPGESWTFTFEKVGTWGYHNHLNAGQWGKIIVQ